MRMLDRKLVRELWRLRAQVFSIALLVAAGVATLVLGVATYQSLFETREAYYDRSRFADVFAQASRAPEHALGAIERIPGVAMAESRIVDRAILDLEDMIEPGSAQLVSVPDHGEPLLNTLYMRAGALPDPTQPDQVVVNEGFARVHGLDLGDSFGAILNGQRRDLRIVGIALSPEFIYSLAPGALMPDDRRFAIVWMSRRALAAAFDLEGAFSSVTARLLPGALEADVIDRIDDILASYGGLGAHGRDGQQSNVFLDAELQQLQGSSAVLPPIFLFIAAFLVNLTLSRLIALEREQIGLMKALGYSSLAVAWHYLKFVLAIGAIGVIIGFGAGSWLGRELANLYSQYFHFPYLIFRVDTSVYLLAATATMAAASLGAAKAVWGVVRLSPSVAMQPAAPPRYRRGFATGLASRFSQATVMIIRNIVRWPLRAVFTMLGMALAVSVLVASMFAYDAIDHMIDLTYYKAERQDASIVLNLPRPEGALFDIERLPGIMAAEPVRAIPVELANGHLTRRVAIDGRHRDATLSQLVDEDGRWVPLPETGLVLSDWLARTLELQVGDLARMQTLDGRAITAEIPVTAIVRSYVGSAVYMDLGELNRIMGDGPLIGGANIRLDPTLENELFARIKQSPAIVGVSLQSLAREALRETMDENILLMTGVFAILASIIAFGVIYNSARIQLSERGRELASLRVLGFTKAEVSWILLAELALLTLLALPVGWLIGFGLAAAMAIGFETELFRIPLIVERSTYAMASLIVLAAALGSALIVRRRVGRLDLIEVLKTRE
ncbi:ABC transporter permease [Pelagibacterium limicola]|uniref:ABC transporter permease n=1 Tax=Pelagibacterium limicola TaxID=2791022 RepID=UPI0018AFEA5D|nr:ABC transporter permease [Pelagibacterium limicola]